MKKNILLLLCAIVFFECKILSQPSSYCWNNLNTITTDWKQYSTSGPSYNNWDWTLQGLLHPIYLHDDMNIYSRLIELPYFCTKGTGTGSCGNNNTYPYELIGNNNENIKPEDGWELIIKDFGTQNTNPSLHDGRGVANPYFILYNRFTGHMKIYVASMGANPGNSAYLQIGFYAGGQLTRALYSHAYPISKTLAEFDNTLNFKSVNEYVVKTYNDDYDWLVSEIQTAYDPCTCYLTGQQVSKNASIKVQPFIINTTTLTATIEGTVKQKLIDNGTVQSESDGKTSLSTDASGAVQAAIKGYSTWSDYSSTVNDILDKENSQYKDKLTKDWFDEYVKKHPEYQGLSNLTDKQALWDAVGKTDDEFKKGLGLSKITDYQESSGFTALKSIASAIPYVGTAISIIDFLFSGGSDQTPPKPSPPMVFDVSLQVNGTLVNPTPKTPISFLDPGSPQLSSNPSVVPTYNNILGVFNMLKPPAFKYGKIALQPGDLFRFEDELGNVFAPGTQVTRTNYPTRSNDFNNIQNESIFKQYKLNEPIKYIVNPAAKVSLEMIDACFIVEYNNSPSLQVTNTKYTNLHDNPSYPYYDGIFQSGISLSDRIISIGNSKSNLELEYRSADNSVLRFRSKYVPLTCLTNESFILYNGIAPKIYVKMLVKMKRTDNPNAEEITEIVTYDISSSFLSPLLDQSAPPSKVTISLHEIITKINRLSQYDFVADYVTFKIPDNPISLGCSPYYGLPAYQNITYTTNMASQSNLYGTITFPDYVSISNNTYIKASKIILGKHLAFGTNVHLISAEQMEVDPENTISPEVILEIQPQTNLDLWQCPANIDVATLKATDDEILTLCNSSNYVNSTFNKKGNENSNDNIKAEPQNGKVLSISPNPTNGIASIQFSSSDKSMVTIEIFNLTGKLLSTPVKELEIKDGMYNWNIDLGNFENGIYIFRLSGTDGYTECKKVVLIK